jgi:DNA-binding NtrC family response regulator
LIGQPQQNTQVLVISKDAQFREAMGRVLSGQGYLVEKCGHCAQAVALVDRIQPAAVVMDAAGAGDCCCRNLVDQLWRGHPQLQYLLIAAADFPQQFEEMARSPSVVAVHRPFSMLQFVAAVDQCMGRTAAMGYDQQPDPDMPAALCLEGQS